MPRAGSPQRLSGSPERLSVLAVTLAAVALCLLSPQSSPAAVTQIGGPGVGNGTFDTEGGVAVDPSGEVYVVDPHRGTLQKFTNTGGFIASTNAANGKALNLPEGVATSGSNNVVVAEWSNERLIELNSSLGFVAELEAGKPFVSVASGGGHLYALALNGSEYVLERFTGGSLDKKVPPPVGSGAGALAALDTNGVNHDQIAVDPSGTVYVTDVDNQQIGRASCRERV